MGRGLSVDVLALTIQGGGNRRLSMLNNNPLPNSIMASRSIDIEPIHIYLWILWETLPQHLVYKQLATAGKSPGQSRAKFYRFSGLPGSCRGLQNSASGFIRKRVYIPK